MSSLYFYGNQNKAQEMFTTLSSYTSTTCDPMNQENRSCGEKCLKFLKTIQPVKIFVDIFGIDLNWMLRIKSSFDEVNVEFSTAGGAFYYLEDVGVELKKRIQMNSATFTGQNLSEYVTLHNY
eukprot:GHVP01058090.1.p2 GENE.GHVP01058090.1~~GHVP01058090.1.p2  ORF type:complete len:123 (+),score=23.79 GHVP01058090.1:599-967(+)